MGPGAISVDVPPSVSRKSSGSKSPKAKDPSISVAELSRLFSGSKLEELMEQVNRADVDGDGFISVNEMKAILDSSLAQQSRLRFFGRLIIVLVCAVVVFTAATAGLTYAIVEAHQELRAANGKLVAAGDSSDMALRVSTAASRCAARRRAHAGAGASSRRARARLAARLQSACAAAP